MLVRCCSCEFLHPKFLPLGLFAPRLTQPKQLPGDIKPLVASSSKVLLLLPGSVGSSTAATSLGLGHVLPLGQQRRYLPSSPPLCYYTSRKPWSMTGYRGQAGHRTGVSLKILLQILGNLLQPSKSISSLLPVKGMWHSPSWEQITSPCLGPRVLSPPGPAAPRCASAHHAGRMQLLELPWMGKQDGLVWGK